MRRTVTALFRSTIALILLAGTGACLDDDERCGDWEYADGGCYPPKDAAADTPGRKDASRDGLPTGMGDSCAPTGPACTGDASYCAFNPLVGAGKCTLSDCTLSPNDCPAGYLCFDGATKLPGLPTFCLTQADIDSLP